MSQTDLSKLAVDRSPGETAKPKPHRSRWFIRYLLPAGILMGFLSLFATAARQQLFPKPSVTVLPVVVKRAEIRQPRTPLFQAAGWIEPRPTAVSVAALASGVIEELLVVEGQQLSQGEPVARLIAIDAELALEQAEAALAIREGELQRAQAEHTAARARFENPVHLKAELADARNLHARATTESAKLPFLIQAAESNVAFTRSNLEGRQAAKNAIADVLVEQAANEHAAARAVLEELQQRQPNLNREIDALQDKVSAVEEQLELLVEERRRVAEASANVAAATALRDQARLSLRQAELDLQRTVIRAPVNGRVLRLIALPGTGVTGIRQMTGQDSGRVIEMYDPDRLQVRADVRLEDVPMIVPGAPVEVETASSGQPIQGRVLGLTSSASVQKNTLEVKVELIDPPAAVRPEMLVTATFLEPDRDDDSIRPTATERIFAPRQLVRFGDEAAFVWIVDADGRAIPAQVTVGGSGPDGLIEILDGLNVTDKLIASDTANLNAGDEVLISGEDHTIGLGT